MFSMNKKMERFGQYLVSPTQDKNMLPSFQSVCFRLRISPDSFSEILRKELGMNGPEILALYRKFLDL